MELLRRRYAVLDIEGITLDKSRPQPKGKYSKIHICNRKVALECYDSSTKVYEFSPCVEWKDLLLKPERKSFHHCQHYVHRLSYYPFFPNETCVNSGIVIKKYLESKDIDLILYKGGTIERSMCDTIGIECRDLELYGVSRYKGRVHDPLEEVRYFRQSFIEMVSGV